jgi:hypothetical protein
MISPPVTSEALDLVHKHASTPTQLTGNKGIQKATRAAHSLGMRASSITDTAEDLALRSAGDAVADEGAVAVARGALS